MTFRNTRPILAAALSLLAVIACKKEEETSTLPSLEGSVKFNLDPYLLPGATVRMTPGGAVNPSGGHISYSWKINPGDVADTTNVDSHPDPAFEYTFKTDLKTYTVSCTAFSDGYYSTSTTKYTTIVKGGIDGTGSITGIDPSEFKTVVDVRDPDNHKTYYYTTAGQLDWFIHNLAYSGSGSSTVGIPYENAEAMTDVLGLYYNYEEALTACPEGWRLPTASEWEDCFGMDIIKSSGALMGDVYFNGTRMWDYWPDVYVDPDSEDKTAFNAVPAGYANTESGSFKGAYERAVFWVKDDSANASDNATTAPVKIIVSNARDVQTFMADKTSFGASVRCVRNTI